jgi:hypothetical protein
MSKGRDDEPRTKRHGTLLMMPFPAFSEIPGSWPPVPRSDLNILLAPLNIKQECKTFRSYCPHASTGRLWDLCGSQSRLRQACLVKRRRKFAAELGSEFRFGAHDGK